MARYRAPSIPSQTNRQSTCRPTVPRTRPNSGSRPCKARSMHTMQQSKMLPQQWQPQSDEVGQHRELTHLNERQKQDLKVLLKDVTKLFKGILGVYPYKKFHIDSVPGAQPKYSQPYAIPCIHLAAFKKELDRFVQIGVLSPQGASKWGSPTFVTPKKDNTVCWVRDLQELIK